MALYGADIEQVQQLSNQLNAKANDIQGIVSQLSSAISSVNWMGPDADRFRVSPDEVVRVLRLLTFSGSHPHISDQHTMTAE